MFQENKIEQLTYRIIDGRLRINVNGQILYIHEPSPSLILESYEIYKEVYEEAFFKGAFISKQIESALLENDIWSPAFDRVLTSLKTDIENEKIEAFHNFLKPKELVRTKRTIRYLEKKYADLSTKKTSLDSNGCHGVAEQARWDWILQNSVFNMRDELEVVDANTIGDIYRENIIDQEEIREIARTNLWRNMWMVGKKGMGVFDKPSTCLTRDQISLCSYSVMYDNVYENPECPDDKVVNDDDCLDGWFLIQKKKNLEDKKKNTSKELITNSKIKNAKEQFIMASSQEEAQAIYDLNDPVTRNTIQQRNQTIDEKGEVKDNEFLDVKQEMQIMANQQFTKHAKGK